MADVLELALIQGGVLSGLLSIVVVGSLFANAEMWLGDYPPDIREKFGPMSQKARRQRVPVALLFLTVLVWVLAAGLRRLASDSGDLGFTAPFVFVLVAVTIFNLWDLLVIDWLLMVRMKPRFIVLPGTEGMAGYSDYGFHFRAFLVGLAGSFGLAAGVGLVFWWL